MNDGKAAPWAKFLRVVGRGLGLMLLGALGCASNSAASASPSRIAATRPVLFARSAPINTMAEPSGGTLAHPVPPESSGNDSRHPEPGATLPAADIQPRVVTLLSSPVTHLTAGKRRGAALTVEASGNATLHIFALDPHASGAHPSLPLAKPAPLHLAQSFDTLGLFTGRDDWPRVIVTNRGPNSVRYFRFRPGPGWESPHDEQGGLAKAGRLSGYYGVLGHQDPEVLCAPGAFCYEKRESGWQKRPLPGEALPEEVLSGEAPPGEQLPADVAWTIRVLSNGEVWAWSNTTSSPLCRLQETWQCSLPHPRVALIALAHVNDQYLALTTRGVMTYEHGWTLQGELQEGRALLGFGADRALVLTTTGLWLWDGSLRRVTDDDTEFPGGCCMEAPFGSPATFIIGSERGVRRVTFD
jgi:hypothetical protein